MHLWRANTRVLLESGAIIHRATIQRGGGGFSRIKVRWRGEGGGGLDASHGTMPIIIYRSDHPPPTFYAQWTGWIETYIYSTCICICICTNEILVILVSERLKRRVETKRIIEFCWKLILLITMVDLRIIESLEMINFSLLSFTIVNSTLLIMYVLLIYILGCYSFVRKLNKNDKVESTYASWARNLLVGGKWRNSRISMVKRI